MSLATERTSVNDVPASSGSITMTINLPPDLDWALSHEARRLGTTPEELATQTLRQRLLTVAPEAQSNGADKLKRLLAMARPCGVSMSSEALSSEGLYD